MGRSAVIMILGFGFLLTIMGNSMRERQTRSVDLIAGYYGHAQAKNIATSGAEIAFRRIAADPTPYFESASSTFTLDSLMNGKAVVTVTKIAKDSLMVRSVGVLDELSDTVSMTMMAGIQAPALTGALSVSFGSKAGIKTSNTCLIDGHNYNTSNVLDPSKPAVAGMSVYQFSDYAWSSSGTLKINGKGEIDPDIQEIPTQPDYYALSKQLIPLADVVYNNVNISSPLTLGSWANPKIVYCTGSVAFSQTVSGCGILIVDGKFSNSNTFNWTGLIMIVGDSSGTKEQAKFTNGAPILGGVVLAGQQVKFETTNVTTIHYCYDAIRNAFVNHHKSGQCQVAYWFE